VCPRIGIVLGSGGGALAKMAALFKYFVGGILGSGEQWMSWIHLDDVLGLINRFLDDAAFHGPINATAPNPVRNREFCAALAKVLRRPRWARVPDFALRLALGDMADMLLTVNGRFRLPRKSSAMYFAIGSLSRHCKPASYSEMQQPKSFGEIF